MQTGRLPNSVVLPTPGPLGRAAGVRRFADELRPSAHAPASLLPRLTPLFTVAAGGLLAALLVLKGRAFTTALDHALHANWTLVALGALLEAASVGGYVALQHRVISRASPHLRLRDSYDITLAGTTTTRLLPTAGLGGVAVTVWALRARGVRPAELAERMLAFMILLYGVYLGALVACGAAVASGLVPVEHGRELGLAGVLIGSAIAAGVALVALAPGPLDRALARHRERPGLSGALAAQLQAVAPTLRAAMRRSAHELRHPSASHLGALAWWAFDIGVLYAMLRAFGTSPEVPVLVLAYFLGTMFNVLPLPGSLSGGLAAMLVALGTPVAPAIAGVLAYRAVAVWLPAATGLPSLARLRASVADWRKGAGDPHDVLHTNHQVNA